MDSKAAVEGLTGRLAAASALVLAVLPAGAQDLAVRARLMYTMARADGQWVEPIREGVCIVRGGRVAAVGPANTTPVPDGLETLECAVAIPGLVDAHSVVGLAGWLNDDQDQDQLDPTEPLQPELRAIDAYDAREPLIHWLAGFGVTTVHSGHAPGAVISGQTLVAKTRGDTVDQAVIVESAMVAATLGPGAEQGQDAPGTRAKAAALLRQELVAAQEYVQRRAAGENTDRPGRSLREEALAAVLAGDKPLLITAQRAQDIQTALRLADEFGFRLVLDGAAESYLVTDEIRSAGVPVILHPPMARASGLMRNASMETARTLHEAGILVALQSGYESYVPKTRVVLFEAAMAARYGLSFEDALALVTIDAARIVGVDERVGSLEPGKDGDLALYDGDPFEYTTHCVGTVIEGVPISIAVR